MEHGDYVLAQPGQRLSWQMDLRVGSTFDMFAEIERLRGNWQPTFAAERGVGADGRRHRTQGDNGCEPRHLMSPK